MRVPTDIPLREWITDLIRSGKLYKFYKTFEWRALRSSVMEDHHYECEMCEAEGEYGRADTVHHEFEVKRHPEMALTRWVVEPDGTKREVLHPLCNHHHNVVHDRVAKPKKKRKPINEERW